MAENKATPDPRLHAIAADLDTLTFIAENDVRYLLSLLTAAQQEIADLKAEHDKAAIEAIQGVRDHWFLQGGKAQFGPLRQAPESDNEDAVVSAILAVVRAHVTQLEAQRDTLRQACRAIVDFHDMVFCHGQPLMLKGEPIDHTLFNEACRLAERGLADTPETETR